MDSKSITIGLVALFGLVMLSLFTCYDNANKKLELELKLTKKAAHNDSILVTEYQRSFQIFIDSNPECAGKFSEIMDSINTK